MRILYLIFFCLYSDLVSSSDVNLEKKYSIFEFGAGLSVVNIPHYAGSEQSKTYALPFPYFEYQSEKVSLNREGLKRHLVISDRWKIDISFSGSVPIKSHKNTARQDMPDLDWVGLAGPAINYQLTQNNHSSVQFIFPLRFGMATDFRQFEYVGWEFAPALQWASSIELDRALWKINASVGVNYANENYNQYYYSVDSIYSTNSRESYNAKRGYAGHRLTLGINRRKDEFWFGAFLRYRNLTDSSFAESPLVTSKENYYFGVAFAWIIKSNKN